MRSYFNLALYRIFPFLRWWPRVNRGSFRNDFIAGLTGAIILVPQGVAFATIAGMPPEYGLYSAIVPAIIAALFGSSWHLVSGPTTAISLVVFHTISPLAAPGSPEYVNLALTLCFLTGIFQLVLGIARTGLVVNFISHTVIVGFTTGAALLIASSQIKNFFALPIPRGTPFYQTIHMFLTMLKDIEPYPALVGLITLMSGILVKKFFPKFPYMIAAMIAGSIAAFVFDFSLGQDVTKIQTVGALPRSLPPLSRPDFSFHAFHDMFFSALVITMLALTEAVSISRSVAIRSRQTVDANQEFIGQGLSNLFGSFFSSYPSSGSFNRTGVNYAAGAKTPLATVTASILLLGIILAVAPLAAYLPIAAMAGVLFMVAYGLIDFHHIRSIVTSNLTESFIFFVTLIGTLINLEKGLFLGILLSLIFFLYRTSRPGIRVATPTKDQTYFVTRKDEPRCPQLEMVFIDGSIFFGAVDHVQRYLQGIDENDPKKKHVLILSTGINFVDLAGAEMIKEEAKRRRELGGGLYFRRLQERVLNYLDRGGYLNTIGRENIFPAEQNAIEKVYPRLDSEICRNCQARIFRQCNITLPNGEPRVN